MSDLSVNNRPTILDHGHFAKFVLTPDTGDGWRVAVRWEGEDHAIGLRFGRKCDALLAKAALEKHGLSTAGALMKTTASAAAKIMAEAMKW